MGTQTLLIVDDNSFFRRVATRFLTQAADLEVVGAAASVDEALSKAQELQPQVVLVDLNMPHASGLTLIPMLRERMPGLKIIVLTMWESDFYRQAALAAGADDFVPKSQIATNLLPALRRLRGSEASLLTTN
jgi:DNA-binding NarL/FixJ family response regulator